MPIQNSLLTRLVNRNSHVGERKILDPTGLRQLILRERDRSDRREIPFSVLLFHTNDRSDSQTNLLIDQLDTRLRLTDDIAIFDNRTLAILLTDTEADSACKLSTELVESFHELKMECRVEVYSYPLDDLNFSEEVTDDDTHKEPIETKPKAINLTEGVDPEIQAKPLSFCIGMPLWKRTFDILVSLSTLLILSPLLLFSALVIKLTSRGPIFFLQWREGKNGRKFRIIKFRTMKTGAELCQDELRHLNEQDGPAFKIKKDPRLTWIGAFLRKSCIDEIPQFFNVLKGEMSLVGPRPLPVNESQACTRWQRRRLDVTPGMTCIWQAAGDRDIPFSEWMRMDEEYIRKSSIWMDLKIMFRTAIFVFLRRASH